MKFRSIKNSLLGGEISPDAQGRTDLAIYPHSCRLLRNVIPKPIGGGYGRPGTLFDFSLSSEDQFPPKLIPFIVSEDEAYCIALTYPIVGMTFVVISRAEDNINPGTQATIAGAHNLLPGQYFDIQYAQSADTLWIVSPHGMPMKIQRTAKDTFSVSQFTAGLSGKDHRDAWPYQKKNSTGTTLTPSVTSSFGTLTSNTDIFDIDHVGSVFKLKHGSTYGCVRVVGYTNSKTVSILVMETLGGTTGTADWWESSWSDYRGWPRSICFFRKRLCFGGNRAFPDSIWLSRAANYFMLSDEAVVDPASDANGGDQAFTIVAPNQRLNIIQWMTPKDALIVGTSGDEIVVTGESGDFSRDNYTIEIQTHYGSSNHSACPAGEEVFFLSRSKDEIRSLVFSQDEQSYVADPVQMAAMHYPKMDSYGTRSMKDFSWDETRKTLWCVDTAGNLFGMTRDRRLSLIAWHSHELGGFNQNETGTSTDPATVTPVDPNYRYLYADLPEGSVISSAVVPNPVIGLNDVWLAVKRKINGTWVFSIERMIGGETPYDSVYRPYSNASIRYFSDCSVHRLSDYPFEEDYQFSGLDALNGKTPVVTAFNSRGICRATCEEVISGESTLLTPYPPNVDGELTAFFFGLPFTSVIRPSRIEAGSQIGSAQGAIKRITELHILFHKTLSAKVGRSTETLETLIFRDGTTPMGMSPDLFTGYKRVPFNGDYDRDGWVDLIQDEPLPFSVSAIVYEGQTYD